MNKINRWSKLENKQQIQRYDLGGIMQGVGGLASIVPGPIGMIGQGVSMVGGIMNAAKKKKEEQALYNQQLIADKQAELNSMPQSGQGLMNPLANAYGGYLTPQVLAKCGMRIKKSKAHAEGGFINPLSLPTNTLTTYQGGGTHNQNPLGGIPIGKNIKGLTNSVENDETSFTFPDGKYVFSNRLKLRK
jgi:hypothetical protein